MGHFSESCNSPSPGRHVHPIQGTVLHPHTCRKSAANTFRTSVGAVAENESENRRLKKSFTAPPIRPRSAAGKEVLELLRPLDVD